MMKTDVYVLTAPFYKTGGTELCHQLVYTINVLGGNAKILYRLAEDGKYLNPAFQKYVDCYDIVDEKIFNDYEGIIVIPEVDTLLIPKFKKAKVYLWWMSVDNYFRYQNLKYVYEEKKLLRTVKYFLTSYQFKRKYLPLKDMSNVTLHLAQSEYAVDFLYEHGFDNVKYLSDFINEDYVAKSSKMMNTKKENIVLYNPSKGLLYTKKIMKYNPNIKFIPLQNMSNEKMMDCMSRAKVYIDFGAHPGKDRMPREAALMGCCIITGKRGSAAFKDVDIPEKYKFEDKNTSLKKISATIEKIFNDYDNTIEEYDFYRKKIVGEKQVFYDNVKEVFL